MTREHANPDLAARLAHLQRVVTKECRYLGYTAEKLQQADPQFRWLDAIEQNAELTERLDAFVSRFCRLQDTLGDKLLPTYLRVQLEPIGSVLDNLNRAEKLGLIPSVADWIEARNLRNSLVHEYTEDMDALRHSILRAMQLLPMLDAVTQKLGGKTASSMAVS
ncbi:MAG: hypothetical protein WC091_17285 [Sulfuricellaceae bacterium]